MNQVMRKFASEKLNEAGIIESITQFLLQKLKEALYWSETPILVAQQFLVEKLIAIRHFVAVALPWVSKAFWVALHFVLEKLKQGSIVLEHFGQEMLPWLCKAFWVALPYMIAILVIVLLVYFWHIFWWACFGGVRMIWWACFGGVRMMRAPGMACIWIPRALFEASPRIYFIIQRTILGLFRALCALFRGLATLLGF